VDAGDPCRRSTARGSDLVSLRTTSGRRKGRETKAEEGVEGRMEGVKGGKMWERWARGRITGNGKGNKREKKNREINTG
jgi:hypothetical protein